MLLRCVAIPDEQLQTAAILGSDFDDDACSHNESLNQTNAFGNPPNASLHQRHGTTVAFIGLPMIRIIFRCLAGISWPAV